MFMLHALMVLIAVLLDYLLGEPKRYHPLAGFGRLAVILEGILYGARRPPAGWLRVAGLLAWLILIVPWVLLVWWLSGLAWLHYVLEAVLLYLTLGAQSLGQHAHYVAQALQQRDLPLARQRVGMMVSRDTEELDDTAVVRATIESVLENGCDAIFATLFWFVLLGAPGVVLYRLANTLDAMWGYRSERYRHFGWAAARIDDALNWIPARLTALTYILVGNRRAAWQCWRQQARLWSGSNPGVVMATGAGALNLTLGGAAPYHGLLKERPLLGTGPQPELKDIKRSVEFVQRGLWLWLVVIFIGSWWLA